MVAFSRCVWYVHIEVDMRLLSASGQPAPPVVIERSSGLDLPSFEFEDDEDILTARYIPNTISSYVQLTCFVSSATDSPASKSNESASREQVATVLDFEQAYDISLFLRIY